jgi:hypothetical protein
MCYWTFNCLAVKVAAQKENNRADKKECMLKFVAVKKKAG